MNDEIDNTHPIALVIFAHNESSVIRKTIDCAMKSLAAGDNLFVVADNCTDDTARIALEGGAKIFHRDHGPAYGKGAAMVWFVRSYWAVLRNYSRLVILDADSLISTDFIHELRKQITKSDTVLQCFVHPIGFENSPISTLIALSEVVEQSVLNPIKNFLGWSVRLRGTGMVINPQLLFSVCNEIQTDVEDIALTLLFAERNIRIAQVSSIEVDDPKPTESAAASRQRARWFRGQWAALWFYRVSIIKILAQGLKGWSLISSLFLKPRWLMMVITLTMATIWYRWPILAAFWGGLFTFDLLMIVIGAAQSNERATFLKALIYFPGFIFMWLKSILLSFQHLPWLRVRETTTYSPDSSRLCPNGLLELRK
jgi:cellulose synthase/poly-beta-1,6-N-acetylglucosamine synthase-like glycosyltransferase